MTLRSSLAKGAQRLLPQVQQPPLRLSGGHVVVPAGVVQADLLVQGQRIAAVEDRPRAAPEERVVDVSGLLVFPGLINAHDHLEFNCFPRLGEVGSYANSYAWGLDITRQRRPAVVDRVLRIPLRERLLAGGYKNLLAGVTTVCHHGVYWALFDRRFPVRVVKRYGWCHSLGFGDDVAGSYRRTPPDAPWIIHLAEGTDDRARGELAQLAALGCLGANTVIVHGVGLGQAGLELMARRAAGLIWCPASNLFMLGQTAPIGCLVSRSPLSEGSLKARDRRVTLALGSDSRLTGSRDLLAELKVARGLDLTGDDELFRMVTRDAARLLCIDGQVGAIEPGKQADLFVLAGDARSPYRSLVTAHPESIRLVLVGGRPAYAAPEFSELFQAWRGPFTRVAVGGRPRLVAGKPAQVRRCLELLAASDSSLDGEW